MQKQHADAVKNKGLPSINKQLSVESRSSGTIVIQSENCEDRERIKSAIQEKNI